MNDYPLLVFQPYFNETSSAYMCVITVHWDAETSEKFEGRAMNPIEAVIRAIEAVERQLGPIPDDVRRIFE